MCALLAVVFGVAGLVLLQMTLAALGFVCFVSGFLGYRLIQNSATRGGRWLGYALLTAGLGGILATWLYSDQLTRLLLF